MSDREQQDPAERIPDVEARLASLERELADTRQRLDGGFGSAAMRAEVSRRRLRRQEHDLESAGGGLWFWKPLTGTPRFSPACHRLLANERHGLNLGSRPGPGVRTPALHESRADCIQRLHPSDAEAFEAELDRFLAGKIDRLHRRIRVRHDGGHWACLTIAAGATHHDSAGRVSRLAGAILVNPLDEGPDALASEDEAHVALRQITAELTERSQELHSLTRLAHHDLRSPIRTIVGFSEHLVPLVSDDADAADAVERIRRAGARMIHLVERVEVYASLGQGTRAHRWLDLGEVVAEAIGRLGSWIEITSTRVRVGELPGIRGDAKMLGHAFEELIANGIRHAAGKPPFIEITDGSDDGDEDEVRLVFVDGGVGFDPAMAEAMFKPYRRLPPRDGHGTGLGLPIARRAIERHGGTISAFPAPDGPGSRFVVVLPRGEEDADPVEGS